MGSALWDVINLGEGEPFKLLDGARRTPDRNVSVELPARRFRGRPRTRRWTEDEVEKLSRQLNAGNTVVIGTREAFCPVCGSDKGDDRYFVGKPQYVICSCCQSESGLDDWSPEDAGRARAWIRVVGPGRTLCIGRPAGILTPRPPPCPRGGGSSDRGGRAPRREPAAGLAARTRPRSCPLRRT